MTKYKRQTKKLKNLYTHFWIYKDKNGNEVKRCACTKKENLESAKSLLHHFNAINVYKIKNEFFKSV